MSRRGPIEARQFPVDERGDRIFTRPFTRPWRSCRPDAWGPGRGFGDIGTSPLYTFQECLAHKGGTPTPEVVYGLLSLMFWSLMAVVTFKYVAVLLNADNHGEGGILALLALVPDRYRRIVGGKIGPVSLMVTA